MHSKLAFIFLFILTSSFLVDEQCLTMINSYNSQGLVTQKRKGSK